MKTDLFNQITKDKSETTKSDEIKQILYELND